MQSYLSALASCDKMYKMWAVPKPQEYEMPVLLLLSSLENRNKLQFLTRVYHHYFATWWCYFVLQRLSQTVTMKATPATVCHAVFWVSSLFFFSFLACCYIICLIFFFIICYVFLFSVKILFLSLLNMQKLLNMPFVS